MCRYTNIHPYFFFAAYLDPTYVKVGVAIPTSFNATFGSCDVDRLDV